MPVAVWLFSSIVLLSPVLLSAEEQKPTDAETEAPFQVMGQVVDEADRPVAGADVDSLGELDRASTHSGGDGRFILTMPHKPQVLYLRAGESRGPQAFAIYLLDERSRHTLRPFLPQIEPGLPDHVKLVVRRPRKIEAVVVDGQKRPVPDAKVFVQATWYQKVSEATTDANGKATLRVPTDSPMSAIVAMKGGIGMDYFLYRTPVTENADRYRLAPDHADPVTFVLNGSWRITIKVIDEDGRLLPGVNVSPFELEKPRKGMDRRLARSRNAFNGGAIYARLPDFTAVSNAEGLAVFDFIPADLSGGVSLHGSASGRSSFERAYVRGGSDDAEATLTLFRVVPLSGQVMFADGRPAARCAVSVNQDAIDDGRASGPSGHHSFVTQCDDEGHFQAGVFPNHFLLFTAWNEEWAAPLRTCIVRDEPTKEPLQIVLQKATRVHGRLMAGPNDRPIANEKDTFQFTVGRCIEDAYRELRDRGIALKADARRGGAAAATEIKLRNIQYVSSNAQGEFEVFLGPGKYQLRYGQEAAVELEINGEAEREVNVHVERPTHEEFAGQVVLQGESHAGVPNAIVTGLALTHRDDPGGMHVTSNERGAFRVTRRAVPMVVYARNEEGTLAGIVRIGADDRLAIIPVGPAASAHGRLIDAASGEPLRNMQVDFGVVWDGPHSGQECGGSLRTDDRGVFTAVGLVPTWKYQFVAIRDKVPASGRTIGHWANITRITPDDAEAIDLGDFKLDPTGAANAEPVIVSASPVAPQIATKPRNIYNTAADGKEQIAAALKTAKADHKRVLLQFGANWCGWCHKLSNCFQQNEEIAAVLRENYVVVLIDVDVVDGEKHNADVVEQYGNPTKHGIPALVVLNADGELLKTKDTDELEEGDHHDPRKVLGFLNRWKPESVKR